jgi:hypothetical protein
VASKKNQTHKLKYGVTFLVVRMVIIIEAFERAMITALWKHFLQLWDFGNDEYHKDEVRSVAEYKKHALDEKKLEAYQQKDVLLHPMNPLQEKLFEIQIKELLVFHTPFTSHGRDWRHYPYKDLTLTTC